ncbi:MAG: efflux RND transporter periplasmic adaptor subunit [Bacteroidales bacterium]|nr:efflux RND transporter periplasmic adaptor subunit [Bacteroidales bacterium]
MKEERNYSLSFGVVILVAIIAGVALAGYFASKPKEVIIQGEVEATEYRVSGKITGRIERFYAAEGDMVSRFDTVGMIEAPELMAKHTQALGAVNAAKAQNAKAVAGARQEQVTAAYQLWQQASVQEDIMQKSLSRIEHLYEQKVVSAQKYDETKALYDAAVAQAKAARSQYDMAINGATREDKAAAAALVERALGAMDEVEGYISELYLVSPASGIITEVYPKVGELVGAGSPVMTVTDLDDAWFTFNVREDMMPSMKYGGMLKVRIPALGDVETEAEINYIAVRPSYATWRATSETGGYDAKTFEVRAVPTSKVEGLLPGMTVILVLR